MSHDIDNSFIIYEIFDEIWIGEMIIQRISLAKSSNLLA